MVDEVVEIGGALSFDLDEGDERSVGVVDPFAALGGFGPILWSADRVDPPGEGAALDGASVVDRALVVFEEDAGVGSGGVEEGGLSVDEASVAFAEFLMGELEMVCQVGEVDLGEEDVAGGAGAAFAAASTLEAEAVFKPRFGH